MVATATDFQAFVAQQLSLHARATAMNRLLACRSFYRYLQEAGVRQDDPTAGIPIRRDKTQPRQPFSDFEIIALLKATLTVRDRALILMLLSSGCRRSEVVSIKTGDIDWIRSRILIRGKGGKQRWVGPGRTAINQLRAYIAERRGPVWLTQYGTALTGPKVYDAIRRIADRAGVVSAHPHRFRVTFAVRFLEAYGNIEALKQILGHEDLKTTEVYATYGYTARALYLQQNLDLGGALAQQRRYSLADRLAG